MEDGADLLAKEISCLVALCSGKDAWPRFLDLFGEVIYCELAVRGIKAGPLRDDLLQELAFKLMRHEWRIVRSFLARQTGLSFKVVLRAAIRSTIVDDWRRTRRWRSVALLDGEIAKLPQGTEMHGDPAAELERQTRTACLMQQLAGGRAGRENYEILMLRYVDGLCVIEIAQELGLQANAVSQRLHNCRERLKRLYGAAVLEDLA